MEIKMATAAHIKIIQHLAETIWPICYAEIVSPEQIRYMLDLIYSPNALNAQMEKGHRFVIAYEVKTPVGFASYSTKSSVEPTIFRLHKIYVLTNLQTKGIGSFLLQHAVTQSKNEGATLLELNVNKYNPAINFYEKKGFTVLKEEVINIGNGYVMDDYVMVKDL
ncbi:MAG: N-acetyltransferase family protein [Ferruginibacter sp.]